MGRLPHAAADYALANTGQLKYLFSFDVNFSATGDSVPDWWEQKWFPGQTVTSGSPTLWGGGQVTLLQAYQNGWNPLDFYNGQTPVLTIVSGNGQLGPPGGLVSAPLIVSITDTSSTPLAGAPITFTVTSGSLQLSSTDTPAATATLQANSSGLAQVYYQLPFLRQQHQQRHRHRRPGAQRDASDILRDRGQRLRQLHLPFRAIQCHRVH